MEENYNLRSVQFSPYTLFSEHFSQAYPVKFAWKKNCNEYIEWLQCTGGDKHINNQEEIIKLHFVTINIFFSLICFWQIYNFT